MSLKDEKYYGGKLKQICPPSRFRFSTITARQRLVQALTDLSHILILQMSRYEIFNSVQPREGHGIIDMYFKIHRTLYLTFFVFMNISKRTVLVSYELSAPFCSQHAIHLSLCSVTRPPIGYECKQLLPLQDI